jgi:hypothetical protein
MTRPIPKLLGAFTILVGLLLIGAFVLNTNRPAPAPPPLPSPNGYDDFVAAGKMVSDELSEYSQKSAPELKLLLAKNSVALSLARRGLTRESLVPLRYSPMPLGYSPLPMSHSFATNVYSETNFPYPYHLSALKRLAWLFAAEGRLAELENRPGEAADSYITGVRVGMQGTRGGLIIHSLAGMAIEAICTAPLEKLVPNLDVKHCREVAAALEASDAERESAESVIERDKVWRVRTFGWKGQITRLIMYKSHQQSTQRFISRFNSRQINTRMLTLELAARVYELEKGQRPKSAADLVPGYLKAIPQDPITRTNMVYP